MIRLSALDIETEAADPSMRLYAALQPWRLRQGKARITSVALARGSGQVDQIENDCAPETWVRRLVELLDSVDEPTYAHNALFDLAWMIAQTQPDRMGRIHPSLCRIKWRDTSLLTKWLINGQLPETINFSYSLANLVGTFLPDHPMTPFFLKMKAEGVAPGDNPEYWRMRGQMDAILTRDLAMLLQSKLPAEQRIGFLTEQDCLLPVANSWVVGIRVDRSQLARNDVHFRKVRTDAAAKLGVTEDIFTSTKRLPDLLFRQWGLPVISKTPTGNPQCNADTIKWLAYMMKQDGNEDMVDRLETIMAAKQAATMHSKYVKSLSEALDHTGDGYVYPAPRIFGTYTGRFTYSSTTRGRDFSEDKGKQFKTAMAMHQIPRKDKMVRASLLPPEGYVIYEADASGQESRIMAIRSKDPTMIHIFQRELNFHSMTGASIIGQDYTDFQRFYEAEGNDGGYYTEQRQLGKLTNLSCNFRIGGKALANKAYLEYDTYMTTQTGIFLVNTFARSYPGVPQYWTDVIWESKQAGYTQTLGGRRYKLTDWRTHSWITESSAINVPIQGTGADMKEIAIKETFEKVPEAVFVLDLHDANFFFVPEAQAQELHRRLDHTLNSIDYSVYWGMELPIKLPYESKRGHTFAQVK